MYINVWKGKLVQDSHKPHENPEKVAEATGLSERSDRIIVKEIKTTEICSDSLCRQSYIIL
jgi:hypothetical protein